MSAGYKDSDKAYIVESNRIVRECTVCGAPGWKFDYYKI